MSNLEALLRAARVIAVVAIEDTRDAVPLARALVAGGLKTIEVTFRTPAAADAIRAISTEVPEVVVGAGTLLKPSDVDSAARAGARFLVSPGLKRDLADAARESGIPYLPGVMTPSELMLAQDWGFSTLKFFPCEPAGGPNMLRQWLGPFPGARFCPTGGLNQSTYRSYLDLPNVLCVGGMWMAPPSLILAQQWAEISRLARLAVD